MPLSFCERWQVQKHRAGNLGPVEQMYPSESWREWAAWFPVLEDATLASLQREVRCKIHQVRHLLTAHVAQDRRDLQQSTPAMNANAFLNGFAKGLTIIGGIWEMMKMINDIPLTTKALRFNLAKLLEIERLVAVEMLRRKTQETTNKAPLAERF